MRADSARGAVFEVADIVDLARLVRLAAAHGDEDAVSVGHVRPPLGGDFRTPHPAHEQQPRDHAVEAAARGGHLVGLDAAAALARKMAHDEHGREVLGRERTSLAAPAVAGRSAVAGEYACGLLAGQVRLAGVAGPEPRGGDRHRGN